MSNPADRIATTHCLERTSPKGGPFIGYCRNCGMTGLTSSQVNEWCPNPISKTQDDALIDAIHGVEAGKGEGE